MEIRDALNLINRIENLHEIYNKIEMAVCAVMHSYFDEMLEVEKKESAVMEREDYDSDELNLFLDQKNRYMISIGPTSLYIIAPAHPAVNPGMFGHTSATLKCSRMVMMTIHFLSSKRTTKNQRAAQKQLKRLS